VSSFTVIRAAAVAVLLLALAPACAEDDQIGARDSARAGSSTSPTTSPTTQATSEPFDPGPWATLPGLGRCGPQPPRLGSQPFEPVTIKDGARLMPGVAIGRGRTAVVLVHQTDGGGFCGWLSFAARIAAVPGQAALAFDVCGYGHADCPSGSSSPEAQVEQVRAAIDEAVRRFHPRRLVLVGASMGGSLAVLTAAQDHRPDAVVDLSGPDGWGGSVVHDSASGVRAPLLVAMADDEGQEEVAAAQATAAAAGPGSRFAPAESGHGYMLLEDPEGRPTELSAQVLAWIAGT
jgi:dienelactone hydrolase